MLHEIEVSTTSREIANDLLSAKIPGVTQTELKKYTVQPDQIFYVVIAFTLSVLAKVIATMIYEAIRNRRNQKTSINGKPVPDEVTEIETTIVSIIRHRERKRTTQKQEEKGKK
jgi:hypothetical protein